MVIKSKGMARVFTLIRSPEKKYVFMVFFQLTGFLLNALSRACSTMVILLKIRKPMNGKLVCPEKNNRLRENNAFCMVSHIDLTSLMSIKSDKLPSGIPRGVITAEIIRINPHKLVRNRMYGMRYGLRNIPIINSINAAKNPILTKNRKSTMGRKLRIISGDGGSWEKLTFNVWPTKIRTTTLNNENTSPPKHATNHIRASDFFNSFLNHLHRRRKEKFIKSPFSKELFKVLYLVYGFLI